MSDRGTTVVFMSASGALRVERREGGYVMDFPSRPSVRVAPPPELASALRATPAEVHENAFNYLAVFDRAELVHALEPT